MGTPMGLVCIYLGMRIPWIIFLCVGFIKGIPMELEEAALIDGCGGALGPLQVFFRIIFPLLKPILITAVIIITMGVWNEFQLPLYFLSSSKNTTLPMTVYWFFGQYKQAGTWCSPTLWSRRCPSSFFTCTAKNMSSPA